jgi:hypothetical protein
MTENGPTVQSGNAIGGTRGPVRAARAIDPSRPLQQGNFAKREIRYEA